MDAGPHCHSRRGVETTRKRVGAHPDWCPPPEREKKRGAEAEAEAEAVVGGEREMASGWGINGNKGRCYDFWVDFSECMSRCRQPSDCGLLREDYLECLHHSKEFQRRNRIYKEEQRQIRAAARKAKEEAEGAPAVAAHH